MEKQIIAICGLDCSQCEAYQATQADDLAWKERLALKWAELYQNPNLDAAGVTCDGCLAIGGQLVAYCSECELRICGLARGLAHCAACDDYPNCAKVARLFSFDPGAKTRLDALRQIETGLQ